MLKSTKMQLEELSTINNNLIKGKLIGEVQNQELSKIRKLTTDNNLSLVDLKTTLKEVITANGDNTLGFLEKLQVQLEASLKNQEKQNNLLQLLVDKSNSCFIVDHKLQANQIGRLKTLKFELKYIPTKEELDFLLLGDKMRLEQYSFNLEHLNANIQENHDKKAVSNLRVLLKKREPKLIEALELDSLTLLLGISSQETIIMPHLAYEICFRSILRVANKKLDETEKKDSLSFADTKAEEIGAAAEPEEKGIEEVVEGNQLNQTLVSTMGDADDLAEHQRLNDDGE